MLISERLILGTIAAVFCYILGFFTLARNPRHKLNWSFAFFLFSVGLSYANGYAFLIPQHTLALLVYRATYIPLPAACFFFSIFLQELLGFYTHSFSKKMRLFFLILTLVFTPFYLSPLTIRDFRYTGNPQDPFLQIPGPFYLIHTSVFVLLAVITAVALVYFLKNSTGIRKNQLKFICFGLGLFALGIMARCYSFVVEDHPWSYFIPLMGVKISFAYIIFKYQLFEFDVWMKKMALSFPIYLVMAGLPFIILPLLDPAQLTIWKLALWFLLYGILFSLAPFFSSALGEKADQKRLIELGHQLEFLKNTSGQLAKERYAATQDICLRWKSILKDFYWDQMRNPLDFILVASCSPSKEPSYSTVPTNLVVDTNNLGLFLNSLSHIPLNRFTKGFSRIDISRIEMENDSLELRESLELILAYLQENKIEFCFPSLQDGVLKGGILVGSKRKGIFWPQELDTLGMASSQMAAAIRNFELKRRTEELIDLDEMKKTLISNITHEFKTPLGVVGNLLDILLNNKKKWNINEKKKKEILLTMRENTERLGEFIQNLLELANIEHSTVKLNKAPFNLAHLIKTTVSQVSPLIQGDSISIKLKTDNSIQLDLDEEKTRQVYYNLLSNAIKFTRKGTVEIGTINHGKKVLTYVKDTGIGIDPLYFSPIFQKFFRIPDDHHGKMKGTGLGLAIAKAWTELQGGRIWVESDGVGKGSTFYVEFPVKA